MAKNIILLSDGTGNSSAKLAKTNVWRLYQALDLGRGTAGQPDQIVYYDDGVGTSSFRLGALIGGAFGWGLKRNVIDLYCFLCRHWREGDRVYGFGFSRGAFTIRLLTGLIGSQGLVAALEERRLRKLAKIAFNTFRDSYRTRLQLGGLFRFVRKHILRSEQRLKPARRPAPPIAFVGLWDTVSAYGLPFDELTRAWNALFPLAAPECKPADNLERGCHALSIDDERQTFRPVLWDESALPGNATSTQIGEERISQVWFAGMHSDVGGGYPEDSLANVSLRWIVNEAAAVGLRFRTGAIQDIQDAADPFGRLHDSRRGLAGLYRYQPRKLADITDNAAVKIARTKIHETVFARIEQGCDGYAPAGLPASFVKVERTGAIVPVPPAVVSPGRVNRQERLWNLVWWKRLAYFTSLLVALVLVTLPVWRPATAACEGPICALAPLVGALGFVLPEAAAPWLVAAKSHPGSLLLVLGVLLLLLAAGRSLSGRVRDRMGGLWREVLAPGAPPPQDPVPTDLLYRMRSHALYRGFWALMNRRLLPFAFGVVTLVLALEGASSFLFAILNSGGMVCANADAGAAVLRPGEQRSAPRFAAASVCHATGVQVEQGERYAITIAIDDADLWRDRDIHPIGLGGFGREKMSPPMYVAVPMRRHFGEPWWKPIARIGVHGSDEYPLSPADGSVPNDATTTLTAEITARRSGPLSLFLNDAVLPVPSAWQVFYANNHGTATVIIKHLLPGENAVPPA